MRSIGNTSTGMAAAPATPARPSVFHKFTSPLAAVGGVAILSLIFGGVQAFTAVCDKIKWCKAMTSVGDPAPVAPTTKFQVVILGNGCRPLGLSGRLIFCPHRPTSPAPRQAEPKMEPTKAAPSNISARIANYVRHAIATPTPPRASSTDCTDMKPFSASDPHPCNSAIAREVEAQRAADVR